MCPLVDVLARRGPRDSGGDPERLAGGEGRGRRAQGGTGGGGTLGESSHALPSARGDRPGVGAFDVDCDPWPGDLEGLGWEGTVATARAWIIPAMLLRGFVDPRLVAVPTMPPTTSGRNPDIHGPCMALVDWSNEPGKPKLIRHRVSIANGPVIDSLSELFIFPNNVVTALGEADGASTVTGAAKSHRVAAGASTGASGITGGGNPPRGPDRSNGGDQCGGGRRDTAGGCDRRVGRCGRDHRIGPANRLDDRYPHGRGVGCYWHPDHADVCAGVGRQFPFWRHPSQLRRPGRIPRAR